jgi:hypothetical protein
MLMTRVLYFTFTLIFVLLNGAALWSVLNSIQETNVLVPTALIVNAVTWPLALVVTYRIGQVTGVEYLRKRRAKAAKERASQLAPRTIK